MSTPTGDITVLLAEVRQGSRAAEEKLAQLVYDELRRIASRHLSRERQDHTLQPTVLVNDAYVGLLAQGRDWQNRAHFFAVASALMRRILVDYAREHSAAKRGGGAPKLTIESAEMHHNGFRHGRAEELLAL